MFSTILLQPEHYRVIQEKIIEELIDYRNPENRSRHGITADSNDSEIKLISEKIMRDLFKYWNVFAKSFDGDGNESRSKEKDIINKVLREEIDNFDEWLAGWVHVQVDTRPYA